MVVTAVVIYLDGEYSWLEGVALIALYGIVATAFRWLKPANGPGKKAYPPAMAASLTRSGGRSAPTWDIAKPPAENGSGPATCSLALHASGSKPGDPYPLGATWDGSGTNFSVFSQTAESVELCLFDEAGAETRLELPELDAYSWHGYLEEAEPGSLRVPGARSLRPRRRTAGQPRQAPPRPLRQGRGRKGPLGRAVYSYDLSDGDDRVIDRTDSASSMPKSIVSMPPSSGRTIAGPAPRGTTP